MNQFPDYLEFLASLDKETFSGIMRDAKNQSKEIEKMSLEVSENRLDYQISATSIAVCLEFLAVYHKWLEQHL